MASEEGLERRRRDIDHDLLLTINSKLNNFIDLFQKEVEKNEKSIEDHEVRIRFLEKSIWIGIGFLALLNVFLKFYKP